MPESATFGLYVGNTTTSIAVLRESGAEVVANPSGDRVTPCAVGWPSATEVIVGLAAKQHAGRFPRAAIRKGNKSLIGKLSEDDVVQSLAQQSGKDSAKIATEAAEPKYQIDVPEDKAKNVGPKEVHYHIIKYMHDIAETHAADEELRTVLTVPLEFSQEQRNIISACAEKAGFNVVQIISEPAAAVLAYNLGQVEPATQAPFHCLVYRSGGASTSCTVVHVSHGFVSVVGHVEKRVGGDAATKALADYLAKEFERKYKADPRETKRGKLKLATNAETVKHVLSTLSTANCYIESLYEGIDFNANVTRARFENEFAKIMPDMLEPIEEVLSQTGLKASDVAKVILAGGNAKVPKLQRSVADILEDSEILSTIACDEVFALGAANESGLINEKWDATKNRPEIQAMDGCLVYSIGDSKETSVLIGKKCPIPMRKSAQITPPSKEYLRVTIAFQNAQGESLNLASLTLTDLEEGSKVTVAAHLLRDGDLHLALTEKPSGKTDTYDIAPHLKQ